MIDLLLNTLFFVYLGSFALYYTQKRKEALIKTDFSNPILLIGLIIPTVLLANFIFIPVAIDWLALHEYPAPKNEPFIENNIALKILLHILLLPFLEELFFRRFLFDLFNKKNKTFLAYFLSVALFSILHIYLLNIIHSFLLGLIYTYLYHRTNSIIPAFIAHSVNNLLSMILNRVNDYSPFFIEFDSPWRYVEVIIALLFLIFALRKIHSITRNTKEALVAIEPPQKE